jgi:hypothetical protein
MDNRIYERGSEEWLDNDVYHAYHSGHHKMPPPIKPKVSEFSHYILSLQVLNNISYNVLLVFKMKI